MKVVAILFAILVFAFCAASGQTPAPETAKPANATQLETLAKKNRRTECKDRCAFSGDPKAGARNFPHPARGHDWREHARAGESCRSSHGAVAFAAAGNTHIVARGETLTSIAKTYKVTIDELQKATTSKTVVNCKRAKPSRFRLLLLLRQPPPDSGICLRPVIAALAREFPRYDDFRRRDLSPVMARPRANFAGTVAHIFHPVRATHRVFRAR